MPDLFDFQRDGAEYLAGSVGFKLLHWDMGVGKTPTAIRALDRVEATSALILCPAVACRNWAREIEAWAQTERSVQVLSKGSDEITGEIVIASYNMAIRTTVASRLRARKWDVVVLDEIQYLKSMTSMRTKVVLGFGVFRGQGLVEDAGHVWGLTGTPAPNNLSEMYPWLRACAPATVTTVESTRPMSYKNFLMLYTRGFDTPFGWRITGNNKDTLPLLTRKIDPYRHRVRKKDVLQDLPPMRIVQVEVDGDALADRARMLAAEHAKQILGVLEGGALNAHVATVRRLLEEAKVPAAIDMVQSELADMAYEKVIVFAHHRDAIDQFAIGLKGYGVSVVNGGVTGTRRQAAIDEFHEGINRVFVGQIQAAGTAITLHAHGACSNIVALSADWVPANNAQAYARIHRHGQPNGVLVRVLHLAGSIDEHVNRTLIGKTRMLDEIFEGELEDVA